MSSSPPAHAHARLLVETEARFAARLESERAAFVRRAHRLHRRAFFSAVLLPPPPSPLDLLAAVSLADRREDAALRALERSFARTVKRLRDERDAANAAMADYFFYHYHYIV